MLVEVRYTADTKGFVPRGSGIPEVPMITEGAAVPMVPEVPLVSQLPIVLSLPEVPVVPIAEVPVVPMVTEGAVVPMVPEVSDVPIVVALPEVVA